MVVRSSVELRVKWNMLTNYFRAQQFIKPATGSPQSETQARFEVLDRAIKIAIKKFPFRLRNRFGESAQKLQPPELLINFSGFCYFDFDRHILMP